MVFPTRMLYSVFRSRFLFVIPLMFLILGLINLRESWTRPSRPLVVQRVVQRFIESTKALTKATQLADVAPLPEEIKGLFQSQDEPVTSEVDLDEIYEKRRQTVKKVCREMDIKPQSIESWVPRVHKMKNLDIMFCPVPMSSAIWQKSTEILQRSQEGVRSSLVIDLAKYSRSYIQYDITRPMQLEAFKTAFNTSTKVIVTRNPFLQLFEFYVDFFLVPSRETLEIRQSIVAEESPLASKVDLVCGHNVSFSAFFRYLMSSPVRYQVIGNLKKCDVCGIDFDVIGKEDTFEQDIKYVYNMFKSKTTTYAGFENFKKEYDFNRIQSYINSIFVRKDETPCIATHVMYLRFWRQLQIWGFIRKDLSFPFSRNESNTLDKDTLSNAVLKAHMDSVPTSSTNTDEAISQAFMDLPLNELHGFRRLFQEDFFLFGYRDRPSLLFFKQGPQYDFNYYDVIPIKH